MIEQSDTKKQCQETAEVNKVHKHIEQAQNKKFKK